MDFLKKIANASRLLRDEYVYCLQSCLIMSKYTVKDFEKEKEKTESYKKNFEQKNTMKFWALLICWYHCDFLRNKG